MNNCKILKPRLVNRNTKKHVNSFFLLAYKGNPNSKNITASIILLARLNLLIQNTLP